MTTTPSRKQMIAAAVWRLLSDYSMSQFGRKSAVLHELGLTPGHLKALLSFEPGVARPMGACAQTLGCDASTATWLIDRLEERNLVERRPAPGDRRVRAVALTAQGVELRAKLEEHFYEPPAELLALDRATLESLREMLLKVTSSSGRRTAASE